MTSIGVYFSANNTVYDWTIAFLNSFRTFNPDLRLILIPFNSECDRLLKLKDIYNFEVYNDLSFERLEAIGQSLELGHTPTGPYWFRRYAAFWGPCDHFAYLDARQLILCKLEPIIHALEIYNFELLHFDCAIDQVYESGKLRRELLKNGRARGFNSGRWAARKGLFTLEELESFGRSALDVRESLNSRNTDQAFINYCCDLKPVRYGHVGEVLGGICHTSWARTTGKIYKEDGKYYLWDYGGLHHKNQFLLLHWAGYSLNSLMPNYFLFLRFLLRDRSFLFQVYVYCVSNLRDFLNIRLFLVLRKNRRISKIYHKYYRRDQKDTPIHN